MKPVNWVDNVDPARMADPAQALVDVRVAHAWATAELATAEPNSPRAWVLHKERERLAAIAWRLKDAAGGVERQRRH